MSALVAKLRNISGQAVFKNSMAVVLGTFIYKVGFLAKDVVLTSKLGLGHELTLFVTAFLVPSFFCNTIAQSLQVGSSPAIVESQKTLSLDYLGKLFLKVLVIGIISFSILTLLIPVIFPSFDAQEISHLRLIGWISMPFFLFMPIRGVLGQVLYLRQHFLLNFSLALVSSFGLIIYLLLFTAPNALELMWALSISSLVETLIVFSVAVACGGIKKKMNSAHMSYREIFFGLVFQFLLMLPPLIDQLLAHLKDARFLTAFSYAIKIPNIITTVSMIVASSVFLPYFLENKGKSVSRSRMKEMALMALAPVIIFWILVPYVSPYIVQLIFQRGAFTAEDTALIASIQTLYFFSAPLTAVFMVYIRYLNAQNSHREASWYLAGLCLLSLAFGLLWKTLGRYDLIPLSIMGSYGILLFLAWIYQKKKKVHGIIHQ